MNLLTPLTTTLVRRAPQPIFGSLPGWAVLAGLLWGLGAGRPAAAQTTAPADTSRVSYGEENAAAPPTPTVGTFKRGYGQLVRLQIDEHRLWKLGLNNLQFEGSGDYQERQLYGLHFIYEQKLRKAPWAVLTELSPGLLRYHGAAATDTWNTSFAVNGQVAGRYYYNLPNRIRKGKSANNFSANYLSLALGGSAGRHSLDTPFHYYETDGTALRLDGALLYGLQRRLGRYGFVDFNFGVPFRLLSGRDTPLPDKSVGLAVSLRIGLALGH